MTAEINRPHQELQGVFLPVVGAGAQPLPDHAVRRRRAAPQHPADPDGDDSTPGSRPCSYSPTCAEGDTRRDLAQGFGIGTSTVYRYLREGVELLAAMAPTLAQAIAVAQRKAFVICDGTLLRIDRIGMTGGPDRRA